MDQIRQEIHVSFRYPVHFTAGVFSPSNPVLRSVIEESPREGATARVLFVVDRGVARAHPNLVAAIETYCLHHGDALALAGPVLVVQGGEQVKNDPRQLAAIQNAIHGAALCRHSYVAAIGGGAVLDAVGYAAATAHRGVRLIRIPTTVLAQDDSALGVKNAVNAFGMKNYLGTFAPPFAVINDSTFLETLCDRDWRAGMSEAVKAGLVKDASFFEFIETNAAALVGRDLPLMKDVIRRSAELHLQHIATGGDPFELGSSRPLDFGHWAAHKLEQVTEHRLRHGEAVAIGIALDSTYACLSGFLPENAWRRILDLLLALQLPIWAPELGQHLEADDDPKSVLRGLEEFREHLGGRLTIMLLRSIGDPFDVNEMDRALVIRSIEQLRAIENAHLGGAGSGLPEIARG
jgi:3-dehydroquinate synthase